MNSLNYFYFQSKEKTVFFFYNKIYSIYLKNEIFVKAKDISQSMIVR